MSLRLRTRCGQEHRDSQVKRAEAVIYACDLQVCPNGAKVRLNMGITERRYMNWDAALEHYIRARELAGPGFCEPDYWIGVTRINQGIDIGLGAQVVDLLTSGSLGYSIDAGCPLHIVLIISHQQCIAGCPSVSLSNLLHVRAGAFTVDACR